MGKPKLVPFDSVEHEERRPGVFLTSLVDGSTGAMGAIVISHAITNGAVVSATTINGSLTAGQKVSIIIASSVIGSSGAYAWIDYEENLLD